MTKLNCECCVSIHGFDGNKQGRAKHGCIIISHYATQLFFSLDVSIVQVNLVSSHSATVNLKGNTWMAFLISASPHFIFWKNKTKTKNVWLVNLAEPLLCSDWVLGFILSWWAIVQVEPLWVGVSLRSTDVHQLAWFSIFLVLFFLPFKHWHWELTFPSTIPPSKIPLPPTFLPLVGKPAIGERNTLGFLH